MAKRTKSTGVTTWVDDQIARLDSGIKSEKIGDRSGFCQAVLDDTKGHAARLESPEAFELLDRTKLRNWSPTSSEAGLPDYRHLRSVLVQVRDIVGDGVTGPREFYTADLAKELGINPKTLNRYCDEAKVRRAKVGQRDFRFAPASVRKLCGWIIKEVADADTIHAAQQTHRR